MDSFRDGKILYGVEAHLKTIQQRVLEALDCVVNSRVTCHLAEAHIEKSLQLIERAHRNMADERAHLTQAGRHIAESKSTSLSKNC